MNGNDFLRFYHCVFVLFVFFLCGYEMFNANENYSDERNKCRFREIYKYLWWLLLCHNDGFVLLNIRVSNYSGYICNWVHAQFEWFPVRYYFSKYALWSLDLWHIIHIHTRIQTHIAILASIFFFDSQLCGSVLLNNKYFCTCHITW